MNFHLQYQMKMTFSSQALISFRLKIHVYRTAITWDSHHLSKDISLHTDHLLPQFGSDRGQLRILGLSPVHYLTAHSLGSHQDPSTNPFMSSFHPGNISDNSSLPSTKVLKSNRVLDPSLSISLPQLLRNYPALAMPCTSM